MYLLSEGLGSEVEQGLDVTSSSRIHIRSFSFWLYLHDPAGGTVTFRFKDGLDNVLHSEVITVSNIAAQIGALDTYSHGKYLWTPSVPLMMGVGDYKVTLEQTTGYSNSNYVAWCKDWEATFIDTTITPVDQSEIPFYLRVYSFKDRG